MHKTPAPSILPLAKPAPYLANLLPAPTDIAAGIGSVPVGHEQTGGSRVDHALLVFFFLFDKSVLIDTLYVYDEGTHPRVETRRDGPTTRPYQLVTGQLWTWTVDGSRERLWL